jgi:RNA recognition motif-containing protein
MRIVIGNLPEDISEEKIKEALKDIAPPETITLVREGDPKNPTAVIESEMSKAAAETVAKAINGRIYQGKPLRAWVPLSTW